VSSVSSFPEFAEDSQPGLRLVVNALAANGRGDLPGPGKRSKFPRSVRLLRHADFDRVYKQGRRHFAAHLTVFYLPRPVNEDEGVRVGFTVGKVLGGAVVRNRMKRRLREAVRLHGMIPAAMDVVINPKKSLLTAAFVDVQREIRRAFEVIEKSAGKS
jgi:ribonuclease P protein component